MARQEDSVHMYVSVIIALTVIEHVAMAKVNIIAVTDYIPNGELFSLVEEHGCLPEDVVRIYVAEIALATGKHSNNFSNFLSTICEIWCINIYCVCFTYRFPTQRWDNT